MRLSSCEQLIQAVLQHQEPSATLMATAAETSECFDELLGTAQQQMSQAPAEAVQRVRLAIQLAGHRQDLGAEARAWRVAGQAQRVQGDHAAAVSSLETAGSRAAQGGDPLLAAQVQVGLIDSLGWLGRSDEAEALARRLEAEFRALGAESEAARVLVNLGSLHYRRDRHAAALACYERALPILERGADTTSTARVQGNMASVLMELHREEEAISLFEQARTAFAIGGMSSATAMIDANVGFLHYLSGRYAAALAALTRAREEFAQSGQALEAAKCDADMAEAYRELNLHAEALESYARALSELENRSIPYECARAELGRAAVWMAQDQVDGAVVALERADALFRAQKNTMQRAYTRLLRANILRRQGEDDAANREAKRAAAALARFGRRGWAAEARFLSADIALDTGQDAVRAMQAVRRTAQATARGWLECRANRALGRWHLQQGRSGRGLQALREGVHALEQARTLIAPEEMHVSFLRDKLAIYEEIVTALLERGRQQDIAEALEYVERAKSRLLLERVQSALEGRLTESELPEQARALSERLASLRAELSRGYHRLHAQDEEEARRVGTPQEGEANALAVLEQEYRTTLRQAELAGHSASEGLLSLPTIVPTARLGSGLTEKEILVEYYVVQGSVCAWVVTKDRVHVRRDIACLEEISHAARRLRHQLQRVGWGSALAERHAGRFLTDAQNALRNLYDLLLLPLQDLLTSEKVVLILHGGLHGLPFHAFFDGAQYALDRWEFLYAPSAAVWYAGTQRDLAEERPCTALLVGVPQTGLPQVQQEIERLHLLLPAAHVLMGERSTREAVQRAAAECSILHLATHAMFRADNPLFSGLQLADGWLLARDLYAMTLNCDLATLSACQTGVTFVEAGDELFGLLRGFLAAGARSVAASLWPANDRATAVLMEQFYTLWTQGQSKAAALRSAQQQTRAQFPHPYHWAAFGLVGERGSKA